MLIPKAPASCCKFLLRCTFIFMSSKSLSQIFKILFQTEDINIFVLRGVFFSRYVQLKSSFSDEKTSAVKSETRFSLVEKLPKLTRQNIKGKFQHWQKLELCKVIQSARPQWKRWWDEPLIGGNVWYFYFLSSMCTHVL